MKSTKEKILIIIQAILVYLIAFCCASIFFAVINLVVDIDVLKNSSVFALGASTWTVVSAIIIGSIKYRNDL